MSTKPHPLIGHSYSVTGGTYIGEMFVYIEESPNEFHFISVPKNINRNVPKDKFYFGLENGILEHVLKIEPKVFKLLSKQYTFNLNNAK